MYPILKSALRLDFRHIGLITLTNQLTASILQPFIGFYTDRRPQPYALAVGMSFTMAGIVFVFFASEFTAVLPAGGGGGNWFFGFPPSGPPRAPLSFGGPQW